MDVVAALLAQQIVGGEIGFGIGEARVLAAELGEAALERRERNQAVGGEGHAQPAGASRLVDLLGDLR